MTSHTNPQGAANTAAPTPADHANTVREALESLPIDADPMEYAKAAFASVDALQAQAEEPRVFALEAAASRRRAEAAEAERDRLADALRFYAGATWDGGLLAAAALAEDDT